MIEQRKLSIIANATAKQGRRVPESVIERDYCLSWFLFGLSKSELKNILIFKGGTALRRCHFEDYRFSEDLDFSLEQEISQEAIIEKLDSIFQYTKYEANLEFKFIRPEPPSQNTYTFYIGYKGPIPGDFKEVKVDVTFKEKILFDIEEKKIIKTYPEYSDFPEDGKILVYSLNEVATEKVCALFSKSRNEPRDLFDIYALITEKNLILSEIIDSIFKKCNLKVLPSRNVKESSRKKKPTLKNFGKQDCNIKYLLFPNLTRFLELLKNLLDKQLFLRNKFLVTPEGDFICFNRLIIISLLDGNTG